MTEDYNAFLRKKERVYRGAGVKYGSVTSALFPFQRELVRRALTRGRSALFGDCGLGKTLMELEWGSNVPGRVLLLAPLAVSHQIEREAKKFGFDGRVTDGSGGQKITITNYERAHKYDPSAYSAVILDESSILKSFDGKTRTRLTDMFGRHRYLLAATATPSPNDFMELGNHAEFLGVMKRSEMLAMFFMHDGGSTQNWRLKGHARSDFWRWVASWASMVRTPSDIGFSDDGYILPPLRIHHEVVESSFDHHALIPGATSLSLHERRRARRESMTARVARAADLSSGTNPWLFWCDLNDESDAIANVTDAIEVRGSDTDDHKRSALLGFASGEIPRLVTKPRIGGWGMNWQKCSKMAFVGLSDSYESFYQSTRRCYRFGQTSPVDVHIIYSEHERAVIENVLAKESRHKEMQDALIQEMNA